ncbi:MAG: hypothetical protein AABZ67_00610 [Pseudomonadota bacterium]
MGKPTITDPFGQLEDERTIMLTALRKLKKRGSKIAAKAIKDAKKVGTGFIPRNA